jgi:multidrug resistance efflux pump
MTKQIFTMLGGLRKAMSDLDNAIPDSAFDYDLEQSTVEAVWTEIDKAEKDFDKLQELAQKGLVAEKYIKEWEQK